MMEAVGDPVLLAQICGAVNYELARFFVISDSRLHLHRIVAVAKLREAEAANCFQVIDLIKEVVMSAVMEGEASASEEIHLDCVFDRHRWVDQTNELMRTEHIVRVCFEFFD